MDLKRLFHASGSGSGAGDVEPECTKAERWGVRLGFSHADDLSL